MKKALIAIPAAVVTVILLSASICDLDPRADANFDSLRIDMDTVAFADTATITAFVSGPDAENVGYEWDASDGGTIVGDIHYSVNEVLWIAPDSIGDYEIHCIVCFNEPNYEDSSVTATVVAPE